MSTTPPYEDHLSLRSMPITTTLDVYSQVPPTPVHIETYRARMPAHNEAPDVVWLVLRAEDASQETAVKLSFGEYRKLIQAGRELIASVDGW